MSRPSLLAATLAVALAVASIAGATPAAAQHHVPRLRPSPVPSQSSVTHPRSQAAAHVLAVIPAAGHVYAGEPRRGLAFLGGMAGVFALGVLAVAADCMNDVWTGGGADDCGETQAAVAGLAIYGIYGWSIYDAGMAARRTNARLQPRAGSPSLILSPTRMAASPTRDVTGVKVGMSLTTR